MGKTHDDIEKNGNMTENVTVHSPLGPSAAHRWLRCPGSVEAEKPYPDKFSTYAFEGTNAHDLAAFALRNNYSADESWEHCFDYDMPDDEMIDKVQEYVDYVRDLKTHDSILLTEETLKIDLSVETVPGTADAVIIDTVNKIIHVCDLKYGKGIRVSAYQNEQLQLYAIGVLNLPLVKISGIFNVCLHIIQPRIENNSKWQTDKRQLMSFLDQCQKAARKTINEKDSRIPGETQCRFCKAKPDCRALFNDVQEKMRFEFANFDNHGVSNLTMQEKSDILNMKSLCMNFIKSVEENVKEMIESGVHVPGWKIVEGRAKRQWSEQADTKLEEEIGEAAWRRQLITLTEASKILSKDKIDSLTKKLPGKPVLAPESDKRPSLHDDLKDSFLDDIK